MGLTLACKEQATQALEKLRDADVTEAVLRLYPVAIAAEYTDRRQQPNTVQFTASQRPPT